MNTDEKRFELVEKINRLRKESNAVILAHNYQLGEVQDIADFAGDSLELSRKAQASDADVVVFCGVHFMAETAAILCPGRKVILPVLEAGCPMADMADAESLRAFKQEHPGSAVVCYVNTTAEVKAESDICCTSANAVEVVQSIDEDREIIFVPDQYLGTHAKRRSGRKNMILWPGYCPTHARILARHIEQKKKEYPDAKVVVHPECRPDVADLADEVASTGGILRFARNTDAREIIVGTELGIIHRLKKENPEKVFIVATEQAVCPNMKLIDLPDVAAALEKMSPVISVPEDVRVRAEKAVTAMLDLK